jgi:hypothetical protein
MNDQLEKFIQQNRQAFDDLEPSPAIFERISSTWDSHPIKRKVTFLPISKWSAAAVLLSLAGIGLYHLFQPKLDINYDLQTKVQSKSENVNEKVALEEMKRKNDLGNSKEKGVRPVALRNSSVFPNQLLISRLSNQLSASERFAAVSSIAQLKNIDYDVLHVLVHTMNSDPNSNVRLAALEALSRFAHESYVKDQLLLSLTNHEDPIMQISLIEQLTKMHERNIIHELEKLTVDVQTNEEVKVQAYASLLILSS